MSLIEDLRERVERRRVVVVVGAGVSIGATGNQRAASWKGLLECGIERCEDFARVPEGWARRMREDLATDDGISWLSVATQVHERLGGVAEGEWSSWLEDSIGRLEVTDATVLEALRDLRLPIATTNYDNLLEEVTDWPAVTWRDPGRVQRVLQGDEDAVIHLHGHYKEPGSVVLGYRSYTQVLGDRAAQALQQALRGTFSLLYVGFGAGFQDPNFTRWREWAAKSFEGREIYRHYRLCLEDERGTVEARHDPKERIFALPYGSTHEDLELFLHRLRPADNQPADSAVAEPQIPQGLPPTDWLFGRDELLADLVDHLCSDKLAPVPILGGPGMGKTTLSVHAFRHPAVEVQFGARRYFVRCDGVHDAAALPGAIAVAMGIAMTGDPLRAVFDALSAAAPTLLVLDNLETPWDRDRSSVEAFLSELTALPGLALVASVRGLGRPQGVRWRTSLEVGKLPPVDAERLFHKITDERHQEDLDLAELLRILDGVPLAIRLMAQVAVAQPSLRWVLEAWNQKRTAVLSRGDAKDDDLEVSIALSLERPRLEKGGRGLASCVALLPEGLAFQDLEVLFPESGREDAAILVEAGLAFFAESRLRMLAPVREAVARLAPPSQEKHGALICHFLDLVRSLGPRIGFEGGRKAANRLEPEIGNLEKMYLRSLEENQLDDAFSASRGLAKLMSFNNIGSPELLELATKTAFERGRSHDAATCIMSLGEVALARSDLTLAKRRFEEALPLYHQQGDLLNEATCIHRLGTIALELSDHSTAQLRYEEALPLYRREGDVLGEANCIQRLGTIAFKRSDHPLARERYEEAVPMFRQIGDVVGEATCIRRLGDLALVRSDHGFARQCFQEALALYRQAGSLLGKANCINSLGEVAKEEGQTTDAKNHLLDALVLYERIAEPYSIGWTHFRLAKIAEDDERRQHLDRAREAWQSIDRPDLIEELEDWIRSRPSP